MLQFLELGGAQIRTLAGPTARLKGNADVMSPKGFLEGEGQQVEFKSTLSLSKEGAQCLVGFANAKGGRVFFGVRDDGTQVGVDVGQNTIEKLAATLESHIYPSLPLQIETLPLSRGRCIIQVEAPPDVPPVIGAYVCSSAAIDPTKPVKVADVQAYRRVGRQTQKVDLMWLRGRLPSDPVVLIDGRDVETTKGVPSVMRCSVWLTDSTGPAYAIGVATDPIVTVDRQVARDLPASSGSRSVPIDLKVNFGELRPASLWLVATYRDDWGCVWESKRRVLVEYGSTPSLQPTSEHKRRLIELPPKNLLIT